MKNLCLLLLLCFVSEAFTQTSSAKEAFLEKWENSKDYLITIAEVMPEESYNFKPTERQMSFKEQLIHIKGNMDWLSTHYFTENDFKKGALDMPTTKAETIQELTKAFDNVLKIVGDTSEENLNETVAFFAGPKSKLQILNLLQDHVSHHRGQLIVYLNLNTIDPPEYIGW